MISILTQLLPVVGEIIDRVIPDPKASYLPYLLKHSLKILGHLEQDLHFYM